MTCAPPSMRSGSPQVHLVGWSMGGGVAMQLVIDDPSRVLSVTLVNPVSPYGFGGTTGADGRLLSPDGAGSGGGIANAQFVAALNGEDVPEDAPTSPETVFRTLYVAPGWEASTRRPTSRRCCPPPSAPTTIRVTGWNRAPGPGMAPGARGVLNALAPTHLDLSAFADVDPQPPVLWLRGELDKIVSDNSMLDLAQLGALGVLPWISRLRRRAAAADAGADPLPAGRLRLVGWVIPRGRDARGRTLAAHRGHRRVLRPVGRPPRGERARHT